MDVNVLVVLIQVLAQIFTYVVIASSVLSFFLPPYHPVREALDRIVAPFLDPIRRMMPQAGGLDFSPMILILVVWALSRVLISLLISLS